MKIQNLSYRHCPKSPYFFKDITFELPLGKIHALHGKNGVGKTVLLNLLSGKASQGIYSGEITGKDHCVLVNQRFDCMIADQFSFKENLMFSCMNRYPTLFRGFQEPYFYSSVLERFHIDMDTPVCKLSGGQRQILALLMALQKNVQFLLLDEPTATLDEQNAAMVFEFLKSLTLQDITLLVVCHDKELVKQHTSGFELHMKMNSNGLRTLEIM